MIENYTSIYSTPNILFSRRIVGGDGKEVRDGIIYDVILVEDRIINFYYFLMCFLFKKILK